jgi:hypothetical protein
MVVAVPFYSRDITLAVIHDFSTIGVRAGASEVTALMVSSDDKQGFAPVAVLIDPLYHGFYRVVEINLFFNHPAGLVGMGLSFGLEEILEDDSTPVTIIHP